MVAWEYKTREQVLAAGRDPTRMSYDCLWPDHVIEVDPGTDSIVWEWHVWDHLVQDHDSTRANWGVVAAHPELIDLNCIGNRALAPADWNHCNTVAYNPALDQVVVSSWSFSEIWVIDHSTTTEQARAHSGGRYGRGGDLLYRWGNPQAYRRGTAEDQQLFGPHDVQWIEPGLSGAGNLLIFNNGAGREASYSTVDELAPPIDSAGRYYLGADSAYGPASTLWSYRAPSPPSFFSATISGCQRLPGGSTLICEGETGTFFEVTPDGRVVWKYASPVTGFGPAYQGEPIARGVNRAFKVRRYQASYPGLVGRALDPRGPIELSPAGLTDVSATAVTVGRNPFAGRLALALELPVAGPALLCVYDRSGRRIATLVDAVLPAGRYELSWDAARQPTGTYFCVCRATGRVERTQVILAR